MSKKIKLKPGSLAVKIFLLFAFCFPVSKINAQSVSVSIDRDKILLGEQVTLKFSLDNLNLNTSEVSAWPQLSDTLNHTEIIKHSAIDTIQANGVTTYQQTFTITSFDSGRWQLGPFGFEIRNRITNSTTQLETDAVYLIVLPVDVSTLKEYHPIKDIIDVETTFNWKPVIITVVIIIIIAIIVFFILKNRKKKTVAVKPVLKGTPLERAMARLNALESLPLTTKTGIKNFHTEIDDAVKEYFEDMIHIKAMQLTASELLQRINVYMKNDELRNKFQQSFALNESVKFAKYAPQENESRQTLNTIKECLLKTDQSINELRNNADRMVSKY